MILTWHLPVMTSCGSTTPKSLTVDQQRSTPTWSPLATAVVISSSRLRRASTWLKLALLACGSVALFFLPDSYLSVLVILAPLLGYILAGLPWRIIGTDLYRMSWLLVFLLITQLIFNEPQVATTVIARLV